MKFKLKGNALLNADIITPETAYATFADGLSYAAKKEIELTFNYGKEMIDLYRANRDNMHVKNAADMLGQMDTLFREYEYAVYSARRK